jgi:hypothetical protein
MANFGPFSYNCEADEDEQELSFNLAYCESDKGSQADKVTSCPVCKDCPPPKQCPSCPPVKTIVKIKEVIKEVQKECPHKSKSSCPVCSDCPEGPKCPKCPETPIAPCPLCPPRGACPSYPPPKICPPPNICPSVTTTKVYIINTTTNISEDQGNIIADALNQQMVQFCEDWSIQPYTVTYSGKMEPATSSSTIKIYLTTDTQRVLPGTYGFHNAPDSNGVSTAFISVGQILLEGELNGIFMPKAGGVAVSSVASRELLEMITNPLGNKASVANINMNGSIQSKTILVQVCDPVFDNFYNITSSQGTAVQLANYILPRWFIPGAKGPYDRMNSLSTPFQLSLGGYWTLIENGMMNTYNNKGNLVN